MSGQLTVRRFRKAYREAVETIADTPEALPGPATAGFGSETDAEGPWFQPAAVDAVLNLRGFLAASETLYAEVLRRLERRRTEQGGAPRILDAGGSFGAFGLALARLGMPVTVYERFGELGARTDRVMDSLEGAGVIVVRGDLGEDPAAVIAAGTVDLISCLALHPSTPSASEVTSLAGKLLPVDGTSSWGCRIRTSGRLAFGGFEARTSPNIGRARWPWERQPTAAPSSQAS